jgi:hypothetical protein
MKSNARDGISTPNVPHFTDADCTVDPDTGCCEECGVEHADPCICGGRGYHVKGCQLSELTFHARVNGRPLCGVDLDSVGYAEWKHVNCTACREHAQRKESE